MTTVAALKAETTPTPTVAEKPTLGHARNPNVAALREALRAELEERP